MRLLEVLIVAATLVAVARAVHLSVLLRSIPRLRDLPRDPPGALPSATPGALPSATIAVAARDEAEEIGRAARSWLAQDLARLQVIVVDDRSVDVTPAILASIEQETGDPARFLRLRVDARPPGWLGKCHALRLAASHARGDFILFTDADVRLAPDTLARALALAERDDADIVVLMPEVECDGIVQRALTGSFFQFFLSTLGGPRANRDDGRCTIGVGAFNLVRRSAYEAVGGHEPVRLQVGDDVALVRLLQRAGCRHRLLSGEGLVRLRWQAGVAGTVRGLEKNFFWGARFSLALMLAFTVGALAYLIPLAAPLVGSSLAWTCLATWYAAQILPHALHSPRDGWLLSGLLQPLSLLLLVAAGWNSAIRTLRRGGIAWRGDVLPLAELRAALLPWRWWRGAVPSRPAAS